MKTRARNAPAVSLTPATRRSETGRARWRAPFAAAHCCAIVLVAVLPVAARAADLNAVNRAAQTASMPGVGTAVPSLGLGAVLQTLFGLAVVIGLVFACAWVARRFGLQPSARNNVVRTVGGVSLGGKERVAVVEIGDTWLVLGAAPGNVRLLHTLPAGSTGVPGSVGSGGDQARTDTADGTATPAGSFGSRFRAALAEEAKKRFSRPSGGGK